MSTERHQARPVCCRPNGDMRAWLFTITNATGSNANKLLIEALELYRATVTGAPLAAPAPGLVTAARGVLAAYQAYLDDDNLDGLRDALTGLTEALEAPQAPPAMDGPALLAELKALTARHERAIRASHYSKERGSDA